MNRKKECDKFRDQIKKLEKEIADADTSKNKLEHLKEEMESSEMSEMIFYKILFILYYKDIYYHFYKKLSVIFKSY